MVAALKKVDFPQFGFPASARVIIVFPQGIKVFYCQQDRCTDLLECLPFCMNRI